MQFKDLQKQRLEVHLPDEEDDNPTSKQEQYVCMGELKGGAEVVHGDFGVGRVLLLEDIVSEDLSV